MKPIVKGELRAIAKLTKKGKRIFYVEADVMDEEGALVARAGASFMIIEKK